MNSSRDLSPSASNLEVATSHTPGPWLAFNMIHAERGDRMTPDELGEYVANNVRKTLEDGGSTDFLFISTAADGAPDICHIGNGPAGPPNARLIAAAPELLDMVRLSAGQFRHYERLHRDKATPDGDAKADVNRGYAEACEAAIAKATGADQ